MSITRRFFGVAGLVVLGTVVPAVVAAGLFVIVGGLVFTWYGGLLACATAVFFVAFPLFVTRGRRHDLEEYADREVSPVVDPGSSSFERQVAALAESVLDRLPEEFQNQISNLAVLVEPEPPSGERWMAVYRGVSLPHRSVFHGWSPPDTITLYSGPLRRNYGDDPIALSKAVGHVVRHELAHHFGISDERLIEIDRY